MTQHTDASADRRRDASVERYIRALDAADFETVAAVLSEAETDPELDLLLVEVDEALRAEADLPTRKEHVKQVRQLLRRHLPSAFLEPETGPPTVADVAARLHDEHASGKQPLLPGDLHANRDLMQQPMVLDGRLTPRSLREKMAPLGVTASERYWKLFQRAALELKLSRESATQHQAAARPRTTRRRDARGPGTEES